MGMRGTLLRRHSRPAYRDAESKVASTALHLKARALMSRALTISTSSHIVQWRESSESRAVHLVLSACGHDSLPTWAQVGQGRARGWALDSPQEAQS
mmetsp:Transcript_5905/g.13712  ORF Transcript_5905/g.13712 Transcript_5905/m.13712 type:complete len:97 (+) Transcript_5905:72-362(+)|eukprot:6505274-Prymnesium_polylepis.1